MTGQRWFALESNPDTMTAYVEKLGFPVDTYRFVDVLSTEDWGLDMVPQPVKAVLFLFPVSKASEEHRKAEAERIHEQGQKVADGLWYTKQTVGNACGTVALLHACCNLDVPYPEGSYLRGLKERTKEMTPTERAAVLEEDHTLSGAHESAAQTGQSAVIPAEQIVETHFVAFVCVDGSLYELDGRKASPVSHGSSSQETLLKDAVEVIKQFIARDPAELRFTIIALAPPDV